MYSLWGGVAQMFNRGVSAGDELWVGFGLDLEYLEYGDEGKSIDFSLSANHLRDQTAEILQVADRRLVFTVLVVDLCQL